MWHDMLSFNQNSNFTCKVYNVHCMRNNLLFWFVGRCLYPGRGFKDQEILSSCVVQSSDQRV